MKDLNAGDSSLSEFIEALLEKCDKADVISSWSDVAEPDKDKLISALEADEDFEDFFKQQKLPGK